MKRSNLKIALLGTRGVPAKYGGFETCVEEVGKRLAKKGHNVTVYCRSGYYGEKPKRCMGMQLVLLPNLKNKYLDTFSHTFLSVSHALFQNFDVYMIFNAANSPFLFPLRLLRRKIAINPDGLEWKRSKWGIFGKTFHKFAEKVACFMANRIVADSKGIHDYYIKKHKTESTQIPYGAYIQTCNHLNNIKKMGLERNNYFLQITRFEPENHPLLTIQAFQRIETDKKLVIVGGGRYPNNYTREIEKQASSSIILPGFIYEPEILRELWCNCFAYVHGNSVGGTNPCLLQSMASGCFTIACDVSFNRDVLKDCGIYFQNNIESLAGKMHWTISNSEKLEEYKKRAQQRISDAFSWDTIANQYEKLFYDLVNDSFPWHCNWKVLL